MIMGHATGVWCSCIYFLVLLNYVHTAAEIGITDVRFDHSMSQDSDSIGLVEVKFNNTWFHVCRNGTDYTREAVVICRGLGYVGGFTEYFIMNIRRPLLQIMCDGDESALSSCEVPFHTFDVCPLNQTIGVKCFNDTGVRLVDGPNNRPNIGQVQIQYFGNWTNVCFNGTIGNTNDKTWDHTDYINLNVLCRQLGYPGSMLTFSATSDSVYNDAYIDDYKCSTASKLQSKLHDCFPDLPGPTPCPGNQYAGATCAAPGYVGCFRDPAMLEIQMTADNMTIEICVKLCRQKGGDTRYAVLGAGHQCFCESIDWARESISLTPDDNDMDCNMPCKGDRNEICGGDGTISVYDVSLGRCTNPGEPDNGRWTMASISDNVTFPSKPDNRTFLFGSVVTYQCDDGYVLVGSSFIQCVLGNTPKETTWNASAPNCIAQPTTPIYTTTISTTISTTNSEMNLPVIPLFVVIGCSIAGALIILIVILIGCCIYRRKSTKRSSLNKKSVTTTAGDRHMEDAATQPSNVATNNEEVYEPVATEQQLYDYADDDRKKPAMASNGDSVYSVTETGTETPKQPSTSLAVYAQVQKQKQPSQAPPMYAQVQKLPLESRKLVELNEGAVKHDEGWSDNILYAESSFDMDVQRSDQGAQDRNNADKEGWADNTIYVTGK